MDTEKRFLIDVTGVFRRTKQIQRNSEDALIVCPNQNGKRIVVSPLRRPNQRGFVHNLMRPSWKGYGIDFHHRHPVQTDGRTNR